MKVKIKIYLGVGVIIIIVSFVLLTFNNKNRNNKLANDNQPPTTNSESASPEQVLQEVASNLRNGDIEAALSKFEPTEKNKKFFSLSKPEDLGELADWFENAKLVEDTEEYRIYSTLIDDDGQEVDIKFTMAKDSQGNWIIVNW